MSGPGFPKIARGTLPGFVWITEKIDGTNGCIRVSSTQYHVAAGSRNRWLHDMDLFDVDIVEPIGADNFGFRAWVDANAELLHRLGPGDHFGEWYGQGIGRGYGMTTRRFALFDALRWHKQALEERGLSGIVGVVPLLTRWHLGAAATAAAEATEILSRGSVLVPGWDKPEGYVAHVGPFELGLRSKVTDTKQGEKHDQGILDR